MPPEEALEPEDDAIDDGPEDDLSDETPSEDDEPDAPAPDEDDDEDTEEEQDQPEDDEDDDEDDESWRNFQKKFGHFKSERDRRAAMGRAYWDKTNYASRVRKENEELRAKVAALDSKKEPEKTEPPPPHPDVQKLTGRIESLAQKGEQLQARAQDTLIKLAESDKTIAKLEARMEDAEDYQKQILAAQMETAVIKKETLLQRYADLNEKAESLSFDVERLAQDREWLLHALKDQEANRQRQAQEAEEFEREFPEEVASLIQQAAAEAEVPKELMASAMKSVNKSLLLDLWNLGDADISTVDMPGLVRSHLDEYLKDRDLASRHRFAKKSQEKRKVARGASPPPPKGTPRRPVAPGALNQGDLGPKMAAARARLAKSGL